MVCSNNQWNNTDQRAKAGHYAQCYNDITAQNRQSEQIYPDFTIGVSVWLHNYRHDPITNVLQSAEYLCPFVQREVACSLGPGKPGKDQHDDLMRKNR